MTFARHLTRFRSACRRLRRVVVNQARADGRRLARWVRTRRSVCGRLRHPNAELVPGHLRMFTRCPDCGHESRGVQLPPTPNLRGTSWPEQGLKVQVGADYQPERDSYTNRAHLRAITEWRW